jgi:parvulin-like peptidyl-prolyl isomerase
MIKLIRSQSRFLLGILLFIISISFVGYFSNTNFAKVTEGSMGRINGRSISAEEFHLARQSTRFFNPSSRDSDEDMNRRAWEHLLFLHGAEKVGVSVTDEQVFDFIKKSFEKEGQYQTKEYERFISTILPSQNISTERFWEIVREHLMVQELQTTLSSPIHVSEPEVQDTFQKYFGRLKTSVVRFDEKKYASQIKITPADIEKEYTMSNMDPAYRSDEKRKVQYVAYLLSPAQQKLGAKEKADAKQTVGEEALKFSDATRDKKSDFDQLAKKSNVSATTTDFFSEKETPKTLKPSPTFNTKVFHLSKEQPTSDPIETDDGYYVAHLVDIQPSQLRPLNDIKDKIEKKLKADKTRELVIKDAFDAVIKLKAELAKGTPLKSAAASLKLTVEDVPEFEVQDEKVKIQDAQLIAHLAQGINPGEISQFYPNQNGGGLIVYLEGRKNPDDKIIALRRPGVESFLKRQKQNEIVSEWLERQNEASGTRIPTFLAQEKAANQFPIQ